MKFVLSNDIYDRLGAVAHMCEGERAYGIFPSETALKDYTDIIEALGEESTIPGMTFERLAALDKDVTWTDSNLGPINGLIIDDVGGFINAVMGHLGVKVPVIYAMVKDTGNTFILADPNSVNAGIPSADQVADIISKSNNGIPVVQE